MTAVATEPMVGEDVATNVSDVEENGKEKKRGRKKAEDDSREAFSFPTTMLDKDGKVNSWPKDCLYKFGATDDCNLPVKKELFTNDEVFLEYRVAGKRAKIVVIELEITSMTTQYTKTANIDDVASREKARKVLKMREQMKRDMAELLEAGVDIDALIADD